ncbi:MULTISPECIES: 50S ribosomal protein L4 [Glycomyces]|jgi:large subunit ribosomal protein L4|uniref:Large ribosomal subunit protein uL4 n=2 Tax=Glycomyces TaxID=58113 RepID=A0A9X3SWD7_9ACTN|nr:50S ribosomal protein L4 [Glycomyces lechevalierae]MDA1387720.1 50S ribosomal protein L4 [Glycomyces lechevalierae]MDR7338039.1 large subunit ribosomal protein L4 [Glycomyces lechevalierae]
MSLEINVKNASGEETGKTIELPASIFDVEPNIPLMHQVVTAQLAAARTGSAKTKTRGEVRGGGKKPYRQKGTGRARQGSIRAPQFAGGGVVHGPQPRSFAERTPKKMKAAALAGALTDRVRGDNVHVIDAFIEGESPKTKSAQAALAAITESSKVLVVLTRDEQTAALSLRNLPAVHLLDWGQVNTYDVLNNEDIVFSEAAIEAFIADRTEQEVAA